MEERKYSLAEAAREIGISYARLWVKSKEGKIKGIVRRRENNRNIVEIPASEVQRLKEQHDAWRRLMGIEEA